MKDAYLEKMLRKVFQKKATARAKKPLELINVDVLANSSKFFW